MGGEKKTKKGSGPLEPSDHVQKTRNGTNRHRIEPKKKPRPQEVSAPPPQYENEHPKPIPSYPDVSIGQVTAEKLVVPPKMPPPTLDNDYTLEMLEKDIAKDEFVRSAIKARRMALEFKMKKYKQLNEIRWIPDNRKKGDLEVDMNKVLMDLSRKCEANLTEMKDTSEAELLVRTRDSLTNILYDKDNGIAWLYGQSRKEVQQALVRMVYLFLKEPLFYFSGFFNFMITGPAGSGKTKVAGTIAHVLKRLGVLVDGQITYATKNNLVGGFIGQSSNRTRNQLADSLEGIFFLDEAYTLTPCPGQATRSDDSFSSEAVGEFINFVDKFIGCLVVIVAGYEDQMKRCFLAFNEGMARRFPQVIALKSYTVDDLFELFRRALEKKLSVQKYITDDTMGYLKAAITKMDGKGLFNNQAGDMMNLASDVGEDSILMGVDKYNVPSRKPVQGSLQKFATTKDRRLVFSS